MYYYYIILSVYCLKFVVKHIGHAMGWFRCSALFVPLGVEPADPGSKATVYNTCPRIISIFKNLKAYVTSLCRLWNTANMLSVKDWEDSFVFEG